MSNKNKKTKAQKSPSIIGFRPDKEGKDRQSLDAIKTKFKFDTDAAAIRFLVRNTGDAINNDIPINFLPIQN